MFVLSKMGGVDLTGDEDAQWLLERCIAHKPDVLFLGPLYYLYAEGSNEEAAMRRVQKAIDAVRTRIGCAVIIEAHPGHGSFGKRPTRVAGSSVWLRWLESGIGLTDYEHTDPTRSARSRS
jgi:RecA-family ATPase